MASPGCVKREEREKSSVSESPRTVTSSASVSRRNQVGNMAPCPASPRSCVTASISGAIDYAVHDPVYALAEQRKAVAIRRIKF